MSEPGKLTEEAIESSSTANSDPLSGVVGSTAGSIAGADELFTELQGIIDNREINVTSGLHQLVRAPFIFTRVGRCLGKEESGYEPSVSGWNYIYAALNPSEYSISIGLREELEKCAGGEVCHFFEADEERAGRLGKYIDEPKVRYTLTTGNCLPLKVSGSSEIKIPQGLDVFFAIMELVLEDPLILPDGRPNNIIIIQCSISFPTLVVEGKIESEGISYSERADDPAQITGVTLPVSVSRTIPRITSHSQLRTSYLSAEFGQGSKIL